MSVVSIPASRQRPEQLPATTRSVDSSGRHSARKTPVQPGLRPGSVASSESGSSATTAPRRKVSAIAARSAAVSGAVVNANSGSSRRNSQRVPTAGTTASTPKVPVSPEKVVLQLRLTRALAKVIVALDRAGQKPSQMIERILWEHRQIQDAATIIGLKRIIPRRKRMASPAAAQGSRRATG